MKTRLANPQASAMLLRSAMLIAPLALVACAVEAGDGGSTFATPVDEGAPIPAGSFSGVCVPASEAGAIGKKDLGACGMTYGGRGTALSVRALALAVRLGDSGSLPAGGGARELNVVDANVAGIVQANVLHGATKSAGLSSHADASVADVRVSIAGHTVTAAVLQSNASASCTKAAGASILADLRVDGVTVTLTGAPNQTIAVGPVRVVINEQVVASGVISVTALHVSAANVADVAIAASRASVVCPCGASSVPSDGSSGGSNGSSGASSGSSGGSSGLTSGGLSSTGGLPPSDDPGTSSSGGSSGSSGSSGPGSTGASSSGDGTIGVSDAPPPEFGQIGDACDDANTCAPGNQCKLGRDPVVR